MKAVAFGEFVGHCTLATSLHGSAAAARTAGKAFHLNDYERQYAIGRLTQLMESMDQLEIYVSKTFLASALRILETSSNTNGVISGADLNRLINDLEYTSNITDRELATKKFYSLTPREAALLEPGVELWTKEFRDKFPSALFDLDEGAKCHAFGRSTASVFHVMRVTEVGIRAMYACLGIAAPLTGTDRNWGVILGRIRDAIEAKGKKWAKKEEFHEIYILSNSVKEAWRNPTMHVEAKYTEEEAEHIVSAARGLMRKLASLMDENGEPKA